MERLKQRLGKNAFLKKNAAWMLAVIMAITVVVPSGFYAFAGIKSVQITQSQGWLESAYVEWSQVSGADGYHVYYKQADQEESTYQQIDNMLIRKYSDYYRADVLGLKAGDYVVKVVPMVNGTEQTDKKATTASLQVQAHTREGFAFSEQSTAKTGSGGYNDDGTVADNAQILYVSEENKDSVQADVIVNSKGKSESFTGIGAILDARMKKYDTRPLIIRIIGKVTFFTSSNDKYMQVKSTKNVTIEGVGEDATAYGWGILVRNCSNIEIRNLGVMMFPDDGISLDTDNTNIWVHNNDIFYGKPGSDSDQVKGDGSCDIKAKSTYVTVSYNHFWDSGKCSLCGMSDTEEFFVTYHHNWYDHSDSRHARIRVATVHIYNNYFDGNAKYGVGVTKGSSAFVENNYFRNCKYPMMSSKQGTDYYSDPSKGTFSGENGGMIKAYGNTLVGATRFVSQKDDSVQFDAYVADTRDEKVPETYQTVAGSTTYNNFDIAATMYTYTPDTAENAKTNVTKYAGRVGGGDLKWEFDDSKDDTSYEINMDLKNAILSYNSKLVSIGGTNASGQQSGTEATTEGTTAGTTAETKPAGTTGNQGSVKTQIHNFTTDGTESSFFAITGNLANKGTVSYNGLTLTQCLKLESATNIQFTAPSDGTLILVLQDAGKIVKLNGTNTTEKSDSNGILQLAVKKGEVTIKKKDSTNLYYMVYKPDGSTEETTNPSTDPVTKPSTEPTTEPVTKPVSDPIETDYATGLVTNMSSIKDSQLAKKVYCAPDASAEGKGTDSDPMTLEDAIDYASHTDGAAIILKSGTYSFDHQITIADGNNGSSNAYKVLRAAEGATVTLDFSTEVYGDTATNDRGLQLEGNYWYIGGLTITGAADNGMFVAGDYNVIERCILRANRDSGLQISRRNSSLSDMADWPSYNQIINCTAFDNMDPATHENADGFACKLTAGPGNVFDGCISYCNIDDGWDLYAKEATGSIGVVTIRNCVSFANGTLTDGTSSAEGDRNGFKLGGSNGKVPTAHVVFNCIAFNNGKHGFTDNGNGGAVSVSNCTAYGNSETNYKFDRSTSGGIFKSLMSLASSGATDQFIGSLQNSVYYNSKKYYDITDKTIVNKGDKAGTVIAEPDASNFMNTVAPVADTSVDQTLRNANGTINMNGYLTTNSNSAYTTRGAKFGDKSDSINISVALNALGSQEPSTEAPTEAPTQKPTDVETEAPTQKPTDAETEASTQKPTDAETEASTQKPTDAETEAPSQKPTDAETEASTQKPTDATTETPATEKSDPVVVTDADKIVSVDQVKNQIIQAIEADQSAVVYANDAPMVNKDELQHILDSGKKATINVTDEKNQVIYTWSFDGTTFKYTDLSIDTTITIDQKCSEELQDLTRNENALYIKYAYHGQLPGPTDISLYVGNQYANGTVLYLYYFNEDTKNIELINGTGLTVKDGYVTYTITHCSVYFLAQSQKLATVNNEAVTGTNTEKATEAVNTAESDAATTGILTGDRSQIGVFVIIAVISLLVLGLGVVYSVTKKRNTMKENSNDM